MFLWAAAVLLASSILVTSAPTDSKNESSSVFLDTHVATVPSAASFYVPSLPDIHQDPNHPLTIYAGSLLSDPRANARSSPTEIFAHLFFVMVQNRRTADKERIMFWFNVCILSHSSHSNF